MNGGLGKLVLLAGLLWAVCGASHAQTTSTTTEWQKIVSSSGDFSVSLPAGYIVQKDPSGQTNLFGSAGEASFEVGMLKTSFAKDWLKNKKNVLPKKGKTLELEIGDARARSYTFKSPNLFRTSLWIATKKGSYKVDLTAPSAETDGLARIMASLRLYGKPVVTNSKVDGPAIVAELKVDDLRTSEIVKAALERKQTEPIDVDITPLSEEPEDEVVYTRPVILAFRQRPTYTERARTDNVQGSILARVLFKANGNIGKITIIKGLPSGLNDQVVQAAKAIKFVPAEINGKPVDAERTIEYTFEIY